ncbi:MAG: HD-like signal output (HDOD) protein/signal transduction histidine kinase [Planctomycetota bacterium]|jgi:HD-like signal output (HDOD) protein/signal transduction histidine kinase
MQESGSLTISTMGSMELVRLSSPPQLISKLLDICHDPDSSLAELSSLIRTDSALCSKIFIAINSSAFAIKQPVSGLEQAITLLGHKLVKTMVLTSAIQQLFAGVVNTRKEFVCNAWLRSLYCATFAQDIAHAMGYDNSDDAYQAGLLLDFGQLVFDAKFHEQYAEVTECESEDEMIEKEIALFAGSHAELGADIVEQWPSLKPAIADAIRFHHESEDALQGCDQLCWIVAEASQLAEHWARTGKADSKWRSQLIGEEDLKHVYFHTQDKISQIATSIGIGLSKLKCLTRARFTQDLEKDTLKLARKIRDASLVNVIGGNAQLAGIEQEPAALLLKISREMQLLFAISDVALLFPEPADHGGDSDGGEHLMLYQTSRPEPVGKFALTNAESKFVTSFSERRSLWIEAEAGAANILPLADRQLVRRLKHDIAYCLPLVCAGQVIACAVIGSNKTQKSQLENLSKFIAGYLETIASAWLQSKRSLHQQNLEAALVQEQKEKDFAKLVHEISNPLSVIGNYIDILNTSSTENGDRNSEEIDILKEELERIGNIVLNFKDTQHSDTKSLRLNEELKACIPLYVKSISNSKAVEIKWRLDESDPDIKIARDALRQIVLNLVKNAVEAQKSDVEITVSSHHFVNINGAIYAQFTIADRGKGVDSITRQQLFSPLSSAKEGSGRGIGLSVVTEILKNVDGQIKYVGNEEGGASFEVLIPYAI